MLCQSISLRKMSYFKWCVLISHCSLLSWRFSLGQLEEWKVMCEPLEIERVSQGKLGVEIVRVALV